MQIKAETPEGYIAQLTENRKEAIVNLRGVILSNLPKGFIETMIYGMISYVVPHTVYTKGYHVDPKQPLPFISLASQKNHIALYHMGLYSDRELLKWFTTEYSKHSKTKLDMGKSCIRFKRAELVPYNLIGELVARISADEWIKIYESKLKR